MSDLGGPCVHRSPPLPCPECAYARGAESAERRADERWAAALDRADWDGGVFHYEGRIYPWPRGFVPDCPATWEQRVREAVASIRTQLYARDAQVETLREKLGALADFAEDVGEGERPNRDLLIAVDEMRAYLASSEAS